ncbi:hypothetical protein JCM10212_000449, partial [Sporobolomyces blumeae]
MPPKLTQPLRPAARYRKGQAPAGVSLDHSDSSDDEPDHRAADGDASHEAGQDEDVQEFASGARATGGRDQVKMGVRLNQVSVDQDGKVSLGHPGDDSSSGEY